MTPRSRLPTRRQALVATIGVAIGLDLFASSVLAGSLSPDRRRKLVVIVCRGGLDGLSLTPPVGDPDYAGRRGSIAIPGFGEPQGALPLDATFGLHPSMVATHALFGKGQARIAPAVATPDRERSHFEAQDVLESGAGSAYGASSGWLNRSLEAMQPAGAVRAISIGPTAPLILRGKVEAASWSPGGAAEPDHRLPAILQDLYANDPPLGRALASGLATRSMARIASAAAVSSRSDIDDARSMAAGQGLRPLLSQGLAQARGLGATLAGFMTQPDGKQVAAVSIDNFDTHANQGAAQGQLAARLAYVDAFLDGLATGLGRDWGDTIVVLATEFGRTVRVNGTGGTDHGTASTALLLGGALKRGGIVGDWPTLAPGRLFEDRDTRPTLDMRGLFKGLLRDHMGIDRGRLDTLVFPDSQSVPPLGGIVA